MSFAIGEGEFKDESGNIIKNYYMTYGQDISIPDAVCDGWHSYTDESGNKFCNYRFIKNNDGTFSVLIKAIITYKATLLKLKVVRHLAQVAIVKLRTMVMLLLR